MGRALSARLAGTQGIPINGRIRNDSFDLFNLFDLLEAPPLNLFNAEGAYLW